MRTIIKMVTGLTLFIVVLPGILQLYIFYITRQLPWQKPSFDAIPPSYPGSVGNKAVLVFSKTNGFRHQSIVAGIHEITKAGKQRGWDVRSTENGAFFNDDYLRLFKVVVFLSTTGNVLTTEQQKAFERWVEKGGGYAGIHAASDTEHKWLWYDNLIGTHFRNHLIFPRHLPRAELMTESRLHPTTRHLPARWSKVDEWYNFKQSVRHKQGIQVLVSLNESSYDAWWPGTKLWAPLKMNGDHPISWTNVVGKGRMFYTALGHTPETFTDQYAMPHILAGIEWACSP